MTNIYNLQERANALRKRYIAASITPEEVGGLIADTLEFISLMERNASSLGITKVYNSIAAMEGDKSPNVDGKPLRQGQLVSIYNAENKSDVHNGDIYMYDKDGWSFVSNIANVIVGSSPWQAYSGAKGQTLEENLAQEITTRKTAITEVKEKIDSEVAELVKRLSTLENEKPSEELSSIINSVGSPNYVKIKSVENLINSGNILMGKGLHQNGRIISTDLKATDFIAVSKDDVICIFVSQYTPHGLSVLAIYDENKTLIESFGTHKRLPNDGVITIQKNGYIVLSAWQNGIFSAVRVVFEKQSLTEELDNVKKDLSTFEKLSYNKAQGITGFLKFNGEVSPDGGFFTTPKIEVDGSKHRTIFIDGTALNVSLTGSNYPIFMQFDSENNILSFSPSGVKVGERFVKKEIALNPATKFVRGCCFGSAMSFYLKKIGTTQSNKKAINRNVNFVGMSIWWYDGKTTNNAERALQVGYQSLLREQFDFKADSGTNYCYSGFSLGGTTATDVNSIMNKSSEWKGEKGDIWTLDTIANEFKRNIPIGSISDYDNATGITTFYGALRAFSDKIKALSGENAIVICSNALRHKDGSYTSVSANSRGHKLIDYEFAIMTIAKKNNWYFVDQFRSKITDETLSITTLDGVHLNSFGYRLAVLPWIDVFNMVANAL
ncbi:MAG: SGNH/GDSL hydrolase family protein [Prevotella pallens]|uniref:SGNH/GDSL hydrolase family protein n=1 Tax=Prevotella pallens TaxID=60133 RepID=UPI001CB6201B|nr:SGNH/GDSL hydrolase family protein [Prevotella pallens]MBF1471462.1 SGNH/GDSL hydrolase family protein [Prevotella pallens]